MSGKRGKDNLFQVLEKDRNLVESKDQSEGHKTLFHLTMVGGPKNLKATRWNHSRKAVNYAEGGAERVPEIYSFLG